MTFDRFPTGTNVYITGIVYTLSRNSILTFLLNSFFTEICILHFHISISLAYSVRLLLLQLLSAERYEPKLYTIKISYILIYFFFLNHYGFSFSFQFELPFFFVDESNDG